MRDGLIILAIVSILSLTFLSSQLLSSRNKCNPEVRLLIDQELKETSRNDVSTDPPLKQDKIRFIIQTYKREKVEYDYLKQTVSKINQNFIHFPLQFEILAFTSSIDCKIEGIKCQITERNPKMVELQNKLVGKDDKRGQQISGQTMDFYSLLSEVQKKCTKKEIFFFMEDDFVFCDQSALHWLLVKNWALEHYDDWKSIRVSIGLNGLFLKCEDIPYYLGIIDNIFKSEPWDPIDEIVGYKWSHYFSKEKQVQYVYRYNLLSHIGEESSVSNGPGRNNECLHMNRNSHFLWFEQYNFISCRNYLFSPCDRPELFKDYELSMSAHEEIPGSTELVEKLMKENLIEIKVSTIDGINCNKVCESHKMKCFVHGFLVANSGKYLRDKIYGKSLWVLNGDSDPVYHIAYQKVFIANDVRRSTCEKDHPGFYRICPCSY